MSNQTDPITYSNPRLEAVFENWPMGGNRRGDCTFKIERVIRKGYRVVRQTGSAERGIVNKAKKTTFAGRAAIVDGNDGRTYVAQFAAMSNAVHVWRSDLMSQEYVWLDSNPERYAALKALIEQANLSTEG